MTKKAFASDFLMQGYEWIQRVPLPSEKTSSSVSARPAFSLIVPCYREELSLPHLFEEALPALDKATGGNFEMILIDDGSPDATYSVILAQHRADPRVKGLQLSRNFGHQPAVATGLAFAHGEVVGVIDADLQDPIEILLQLYEAVRTDTCDVAYGVRRKRDAPPLLRFFYWLFYILINRFAGHYWPRNAGDFSAFNREVLDSIVSLPENARMNRGLRAWVGFRQKPIPYDRPKRVAGVSNYNFLSLMRLALSAFINFSHLPLQLANYLGLGMAALTSMLGLLFLVRLFLPGSLLWPAPLDPAITAFFLYFSFVASMIFLCLGIMGEYISVLILEVKRRPTAIVRRKAGDMQQLPESDYIQFRDPGR